MLGFVRFFFLGLSLFMLNSTAWAQIYKYTAPNGHVYYTDKPRHKRYKLIHFNQPWNKSLTRTTRALFKRNKKKFKTIIAQAAARYKVDEKLLHAVIQTESAYQPKVVSSAGAVGLMQLMPATAKRYGVTNRHDPIQNVDGGAHYLKDLLTLFNNNTRLAVAAYNAGENAVKKYKNSVPPYPETRNYVKQVLALYNS